MVARTGSSASGSRCARWSVAGSSPASIAAAHERNICDEQQPLQDLGVLDGSTLQLYVDREVAPEDTAALEKLGTKGGKEAVVEASFVGSALLGGSCCAGSVQSDPMVIDSPA